MINFLTVSYFRCLYSGKKNPSTLGQIETIVQTAFGQSERERVSIYLTKPEAIAIYASTLSKWANGTTILVCSAGGVGIDISVLSVAFVGSRTELVPLSWTEDEPVGSSLIDWKVRKLIRDRVKAISHRIEGVDIDLLVSRMMAEKYHTFKNSFGSSTMEIPKLYLPIPGLAPGVDAQHLGIEDSKIVVTRYHLHYLESSYIR